MTRRVPRRDASARGSRMADLKDRLDAWEADADPEVIDAAVALFGGRYSERNSLLIAMQRPGARDVAGFRAWLDRGRCVRKGQTGIMILQPAARTAGKAAGDSSTAGEASESEEASGNGKSRGRQLFKVGFVFDISQTDAVQAGVTS